MYWASAPDGKPCEAKVGGAYRGVGGDGFIYEELGVELTGCPAPASMGQARAAWISLDEAPGCTFAAAAQDGIHRWEGDRWEGKTTGSGTLPAALEPFVPTPPTGASPNGFTWETTAARVGDHVLAWRLYTAHITSPVGTEACSVEAEEAMQQLVVVGTKVSPAVQPGTDGSWIELAGVFAVGTDPRVIVLSNVEEFTTIDIAKDGTPGEPRSTTFYIAHDEDSHLDSALMPYCGP
jgi:hypothetical protein